MTHPDWVLKHRAKGTHVIRRGENYYLYRVTSVWNREKGRAQLKTEKYLGKITPDGLIPPRQERMLGRLRQATIKEYGASFLVNHLAGDIIELLKGEYQEWRELFSFAALRLLHNAHIKTSNSTTKHHSSRNSCPMPTSPTGVWAACSGMWAWTERP